MAREWTQKHIEELIKKVIIQKKGQGGSGKDPDNPNYKSAYNYPINITQKLNPAVRYEGGQVISSNNTYKRMLFFLPSYTDPLKMEQTYMTASMLNTQYTRSSDTTYNYYLDDTIVTERLLGFPSSMATARKMCDMTNALRQKINFPYPESYYSSNDHPVFASTFPQSSPNGEYFGYIYDCHNPLTITAERPVNTVIKNELLFMKNDLPSSGEGYKQYLLADTTELYDMVHSIPGDVYVAVFYKTYNSSSLNEIMITVVHGTTSSYSPYGLKYRILNSSDATLFQSNNSAIDVFTFSGTVNENSDIRDYDFSNFISPQYWWSYVTNLFTGIIPDTLTSATDFSDMDQVLVDLYNPNFFLVSDMTELPYEITILHLDQYCDILAENTYTNVN